MGHIPATKVWISSSMAGKLLDAGYAPFKCSVVVSDSIPDRRHEKCPSWRAVVHGNRRVYRALPPRPKRFGRRLRDPSTSSIFSPESTTIPCAKSIIPSLFTQHRSRHRHSKHHRIVNHILQSPCPEGCRPRTARPYHFHVRCWLLLLEMKSVY